MLEFKLPPACREVCFLESAKFGFGKDRQPEAERDFCLVGDRIGENRVVSFEVLSEKAVIRRRVDLVPSIEPPLDLLEKNHVRFLPAKELGRLCQIDPGIVRGRLVPGLAVLHVECEGAESHEAFLANSGFPAV